MIWQPLRAQKKGEKDQMAFGIQISPIVPSDLFRINPQEAGDSSFSVRLVPRMGYTVGALARFGLSRRFSMQVGISHIRRNFRLEPRVDELERESLRIRVVNYEIPVTVTYYVPFTPQLLLNSSVGVSANFLPTGLLSRQAEIAQGSRVTSWVVPSFPLHLGLEYRSMNWGYIYGGIAYHLFVTDLYNTVIVYRLNQPDQKAVRMGIRGDYFSLSLRYFFPTRK